VRLIDADKIEFHGLNNRVCPDLAATDVIEEQPTIDAAPVVYGEWIITINEHFRTCSICNISLSLKETEIPERFKFCPFCGANMTKRD